MLKMKQGDKLVLFAVSALSLLFLLGVIIPEIPPEYKSGCPMTQGRLFVELETLKTRAGIKNKIIIKPYFTVPLFDRPNAHIKKDANSELVIYISSHFCKVSISTTAIRTVLAHELGHAKFNTDPQKQTALELYREEIEADKFAINLIGMEEFRTGLIDLGLSNNEIKTRLERLQF